MIHFCCSFLKGEKTFFLQPGEKLAKGIQDVYVLEDDEGLILRCIETFKEQGVSTSIRHSFLLIKQFLSPRKLFVIPVIVG